MRRCSEICDVTNHNSPSLEQNIEWIILSSSALPWRPLLITVINFERGVLCHRAIFDCCCRFGGEFVFFFSRIVRDCTDCSHCHVFASVCWTCHCRMKFMCVRRNSEFSHIGSVKQVNRMNQHRQCGFGCDAEKRRYFVCEGVCAENRMRNKF